MKLSIKKRTVFFFAFLLYLAINPFLPVTDPVEATYALSAKEMMEHGRWLTPTLFGAPWFDKPVLFYLLTSLSFRVFGVSAVAAHIMPALFAAASVTLLFWFVRRHASAKEALYAALVLGSSLQFLVLSKLIITDMVLFFFVSAALAFLYTGWREKEQALRWTLAAYGCAAFAVLTKGPVGLILPGMIFLAFLAYKKDAVALKTLFHPAGLLVFVSIALPWYAFMAQQFGDQFLSTFFGLHNYLRATVSEHPKDNFILYYPLLFLLSTLPWSLSTLRAFYEAIRGTWRKEADDLTVLSVLGAGIYLVFYSLMATKYPTYTFPALFFAVIPTARHLASSEEHLLKQLRPALLLLTLLFVALSVVFSHSFGKLAVPLLLLGMLYYTWKQGVKKPVIVGAVFMLAAFMLTAGTSLANLAQSRSGETLSRTFQYYGQTPIGLYRTYSTSAVFYSGANLIKLEDTVTHDLDGNVWGQKYPVPTESVAEFVAETAGDRPTLVVVKAQDKNAFEQVSRQGQTLDANTTVTTREWEKLAAATPQPPNWKKDLHAYSPSGR